MTEGKGVSREIEAENRHQQTQTWTESPARGQALRHRRRNFASGLRDPSEPLLDVALPFLPPQSGLRESPARQGSGKLELSSALNRQTIPGLKLEF